MILVIDDITTIVILNVRMNIFVLIHISRSKNYNNAAMEVMSKYSIETNDLYNFAKNNWEKVGRKADVHFTPSGSKELAKLVAKSIEAQLKN